MKLTTFILLIFLSNWASAQFEDEFDYSTEFTWGINKNTHSALIGGFAFKWGQQKKSGLFHTYAIDILNVTSPKEQKYYASTSGTNFIWGKANYLYSIRFLYGREKLLYKKAPQQGVQISTLFGGGPTWAIISPYYVLGTNGTYSKYTVDVFPSRSSIGGSGKIFQGLGESEHQIGLNAKAGLSFEFGAFKNSVAGLEAGLAVEAFTKKIPIMAESENQAIFRSLYFTLYWGKRR
ncbi:MAG: hypothetical protein ACJA08_000355 [Cyclobacteriaceae bacterium]|jgi:hypothetical protein